MREDRKSYEITQRVLAYINKNDLIFRGSHVIVGLSGGTDSVCLFRMLIELREELGISVSAIHIHHGIREVTADRDAEFVRELCEKESVPLTLIHEDIPAKVLQTGESIEECARRVRYEHFDREVKKYENSVVAVAHHIDDQAETVLFRMIRGTGIKGLKAMRGRNGYIIRPLLCLTREEILDYINYNGIDYCIDETNEDTEYSRNGIRHLVMPELDRICHQASRHISEIADEAAKIDGYLDKKASELYKEAIIEDAGKKRMLSVRILTDNDEVIITRTIRMMIGNMTQSLKDVTREHVDSVMSLLYKEKSSMVYLPKELTVLKEGDSLIFTVGNNEKKCAKDICIGINIPGVTKIDEEKSIECEIQDNEPGIMPPRNLYTKWIDCDKIKPDLCIRTRREGDYLVADAKGSHKSISRYMIDEKIPRSLRDNVLLLASGSEVYWVIGYRISESVKITDETTKVAKITIREIKEQ